MIETDRQDTPDAPETQAAPDAPTAQSAQTIPVVQTTQSAQNDAQQKRMSYIMLGLVALQTLLVTLALVPPQFWTRFLPGSPTASLDGPFPVALAPIISALLYVIPSTIGFLNKSWQRALLYATIPAWIGLGLFVIAASLKIGAFN
ncbi:MAG TPA: hypothetical protein VGT44_10730, partial [Ktedonobacteraceae bacterium]|nr:hypothetical protein [Ktedonobacteraceae bacterium]